jgi:hypothetical protein
MDDGADQHVASFLSVEHEMRLKTEPAKPDAQFIGLTAHARKISQQSKNTIKSGEVCVGLITPEIKFGKE